MNHVILLKKLRCYGISGPNLEWFRDNLLIFFNSLFTWLTSDNTTGFHVSPRGIHSINHIL